MHETMMEVGKVAFSENSDRLKSINNKMKNNPLNIIKYYNKTKGYLQIECTYKLMDVWK